jgi:hypothetical protein
LLNLCYKSLGTATITGGNAGRSAAPTADGNALCSTDPGNPPIYVGYTGLIESVGNNSFK